MIRALAGLIFACAVLPAQIAWTQRTASVRSVAWFDITYDPTTQKTLFPVSDAEVTGIYSNSVWSLDLSLTSPAGMTNIGTTGATGDPCTPNPATWTFTGGATGNGPPNRHPTMTAVDTTRGKYFWTGGVCGGSTEYRDTWVMTLNADPSANRWTLLEADAPGIYAAAKSMVYVPTIDALVAFGANAGGFGSGWIFCFKTGALTSDQTTAGCSTGDQWESVAITGETDQACGSVHDDCPPGHFLPTLYWDSSAARIVQFGGGSNQVWTYDPLDQRWRLRHDGTGTAPATADGTQLYGHSAVAGVGNGRYYLHASYPDTPHDWRYDYAANTWTDLGALGGSTKAISMAYDAAHNALVIWGQSTDGQGAAEVWVGQLETSGVRGASRITGAGVLR